MVPLFIEALGGESSLGSGPGEEETGCGAVVNESLWFRLGVILGCLFVGPSLLTESHLDGGVMADEFGHFALDVLELVPQVVDDIVLSTSGESIRVLGGRLMLKVFSLIL